MTKNRQIEIKLLGGTSLNQGGQPLSGNAVRRHPLALLALLATAPEYAMSRPKVIGILWPDTDETTARNRLSSTLYLLRKALGPEVLTSSADTLRLNSDEVACDLWRLHQAIEADSHADVARIYSGPFLDGFYLDDSELFEERVERKRRELNRAWRQAVQTLAESAGQDEQHGEAAHHWQTLFARDPLNTEAALHLVRSLALAGRRHEALKTGEQHVEHLCTELGAEPDAAFLELMQRLQKHSLHSGETPEASVAVLFFESPDDAESSTLGEGIHGGVLSRLATVEGLTVIARTSLRRFRGTDKSAEEIGAELGVRWVLEGGVNVRHGQFRIDARLVEAGSNKQVWAYDYMGQLSADNYFSVQMEIAAELFERLRHQVTPDERWRLAHVPTDNLEAHRQSSQARMHLDQRSPEGMQLALKCFEEAATLDPTYAVAWVGIADALGLMHAYGFVGPDVLPRAEESIQRALEADEYCAEAHAALGRMLGQFKKESEAKEACRRAVALKPGYAEAHNWLTIGYQVSGDIEAAFDSSRRAAALNPLSAECVSNLASTLIFRGELEEALRITGKTLELEPDYDTAVFYAALTVYAMRQFDEVLKRLDGLTLPWVGAGVETLKALAHVGLGNDDKAREWLNAIRATGYAFDEGLVLLALGENDKALAAFRQADFDGIDFAVSYWPTVCIRYLFKPIWESAGDDALYAEIVTRIDRSWGLTR